MVSVKVRKVGNSLGILLPAEALTQLRVSEGDTLYLVEGASGLTMTPLSAQQAAVLDAAEQVMRENRDVLRKLAE